MVFVLVFSSGVLVIGLLYVELISPTLVADSIVLVRLRSTLYLAAPPSERASSNWKSQSRCSCSAFVNFIIMNATKAGTIG